MVFVGDILNEVLSGNLDVQWTNTMISKEAKLYRIYSVANLLVEPFVLTTLCFE